ncbi:hypothetical protein NPIL_33361 [Nephila pilipes]|uniref:Uncharacterized protein n=1 Tax=Nephila pilipes TaxID=299642 RepID=A0A8X6MRM1_NEPPI|nr:hypothetical protein NPIL_33361 [Nephila pilipes]
MKSILILPLHQMRISSQEETGRSVGNKRACASAAAWRFGAKKWQQSSLPRAALYALRCLLNARLLRAVRVAMARREMRCCHVHGWRPKAALQRKRRSGTAAFLCCVMRCA